MVDEDYPREKFLLRVRVETSEEIYCTNLTKHYNETMVNLVKLFMK